MVAHITSPVKVSATADFTLSPLPQNNLDPFSYIGVKNTVLDNCMGYDSLRDLLVDDKLATFSEYEQEAIKNYVKRFKSCGEHYMLAAIKENDLDFFTALAKVGVNLAEIDTKQVFDKVRSASTFAFLLNKGFVFNKIKEDSEETSNEQLIMDKLHKEMLAKTHYWNSCGKPILLTLIRNKLGQNWVLKDFHKGIYFAWEVDEVLDLLKELNAVFNADIGMPRRIKESLSPLVLCLKKDPQYLFHAVKSRVIHTEKDLERLIVRASHIISLSFETLEALAEIFCRYVRIEEKKDESVNNDTLDMLLWACSRWASPEIPINIYRAIKHYKTATSEIRKIHSKIDNFIGTLDPEDVTFFSKDISRVDCEFLPGFLRFMKKTKLTFVTDPTLLWSFLSEYNKDKAYKEVYETALAQDSVFLNVRYIRTLVEERCPLPTIADSIKKRCDSPFMQIVMQYCLCEEVPSDNREYVLRQLTVDEFIELCEGLIKGDFEHNHLIGNILRVLKDEYSPNKAWKHQIAKTIPMQYLASALVKLAASVSSGEFMDYENDELSQKEKKLDERLLSHGIDVAQFKRERKQFYNLLITKLDKIYPNIKHEFGISKPVVSLIVSLLYNPFSKKLLTLDEVEIAFKSLSTEETLSFIGFLFLKPDVMNWIAIKYF